MPTQPTDKTGIDPVTGTIIVQGLATAGQAITKGGPRRQYKWNKKAANDANQMNRDNALWTLEQNKRLQQEQRVYDSPAAQMERYKAAGLNPHLIYGSGSSSGSAFPITQQGIAPSRIDAPSAEYPDIAGTFLQAGQTLAQTNLQEQKTSESEANTALKAVQLDIAKTNPMLDQSVYQSVISSMEQVALLKVEQAKHERTAWISQDNKQGKAYAVKIEAEIQSMVQKLGLNTQDQLIKNKIFESKEFENAIKKIQKDWLEDGEVSPEHIRQGLMLILSKMIGK